MIPVWKKTMRALRIGEKRVQGNPLRMAIVHKSKTSSVIHKILIQNQVLGGKFILKPFGEKRRGIASLQKNGIKSATV